MIVFSLGTSASASSLHQEVAQQSIQSRLSDNAKELDFWKHDHGDEGGIGIAAMIDKSSADIGVIVLSVEERDSSSLARYQQLNIQQGQSR